MENELPLLGSSQVNDVSWARGHGFRGREEESEEESPNKQKRR